MVAINQDENERELIAEGNQSIDGPMIEKMRAGMNQILAKQGRQLITPETLYGLVSQANVSEKICTKWGGAYSQSGIEKILLTQVP